jgi:dTDP-4-amino-4,6-dideoxy-D-galactose acyltransferase
MSAEPPRLAPLEWDTRHFGFPVARIEDTGDAPGALDAVLDRARATGVRLVYWNAPLGIDPPDDVLARYCGALVDRKQTLTRPLDGSVPRAWDDALVRVWPKGPAPDALVRLALASGERSRFRVDPRFPPPLFEELYTQWIERSTNGAIADAVLVAADPHPLGLITVAVKDAVGHIGLLAVDERARGRGLGADLLVAAHAFMVSRGCSGASVVTQGDNEPALRLYGRAGYRTAARTDVYHFWPLARVPDPVERSPR